MLKVVTLTREQYNEAFVRECKSDYPAVASLEREMGHALDRKRLESSARVLACPVKVNAPNWQHGRVIYSVLSNYLNRAADWGVPVRVLDIGTAKGFSALCALYAIADFVTSIQGRADWYLDSVDVIDPNSYTRRNTLAEVDGLKTLEETWEAVGLGGIYGCIGWHCATGISYLSSNQGRINFAFVDGKHNFAAVSMEGEFLARFQNRGDITIFDDTQIPGVGDAVRKLKGYDIRELNLGSADRSYAICTRK